MPKSFFSTQGCQLGATDVSATGGLLEERMRTLLAFAALLHFSGSVTAFCPHIRATRTLSPRRAFPALRAQNEFDVWWAERRVRQTHVLDTLPLDVPSLTLVLQEFVGSNYASQVCSRCNLQPTDYGVISGM